MAKRSTIADPMPQEELRQRGIAFWLGLLALAVILMGAFSCVGTRRLQMETTASGLEYQILREGDGEQPGPDDTVLVHYEGTLPDGTVFDSSYARGEPAVFGVGQVIPGWTEGLQLMQTGSKYRFLIPSQLAYGPAGVGNGAIPPNADLVFEVELLGVASPQDLVPPPAPALEGSDAPPATEAVPDGN
ncbi:MAG: FKBP-type peptidyl-prolyl cis-trans isomerase [Pseudomonadota bacterium]